jgi:hypothetical protein
MGTPFSKNFEPLQSRTHQGTMQRTIHQIKLMPVSTAGGWGDPHPFFYSSSWREEHFFIEGRNMLAEILNLAPGVCVLLALGALLYVTRT